ncbi:hypothetical protein KRR40_42085 [Niabella defluvii]|nr:hypothetical protein KRR40_42085 [Niabella sp. I65]
MFIFNTLPLILLGAGVVSINAIVVNRYTALGITIIITLIWSTPLAAKLITMPALRFLSGFNGVYSDFSGYDRYLYWFVIRWLLGCSVIVVIILGFRLLKKLIIK